MTYDYKKGDILIDSTGDYMEYLGNGKYRWITFNREESTDSKPQTLSELNHQITHRKLTKLEKVIR